MEVSIASLAQVVAQPLALGIVELGVLRFVRSTGVAETKQARKAVVVR